MSRAGWWSLWLVATLCLNAGSARAFTFQVKNERELTRALARLRPGNTVLLADGVYRTSLRLTRSGTADEPILIRAAHPGRAVIDAAGLPTALEHNGQTHIHVDGLVFRNAQNPPQAEQAMVRAGNHWTLRGCTFEHATGAGLGLPGVRHVRVLDAVVQHNGQIGIAVSGSQHVLIRDTLIAHNNDGFDTEAEIDRARIAEKVPHRGRWYTNPAWEAGGMKISSSTDVRLERIHAHDNIGPALWADYNNRDVLFLDCHVHHNRNLVEGWEGIGIFVEYNAQGPIAVRGCRVEANQGPGLAVAESRHVTLENNYFIDDELEFRDMQRPGTMFQHITATDNVFERAVVQTSLGTWDPDSGAVKSITLERNHWRGEAVFRWGGQTFRGLDEIRRHLGFENQPPSPPEAEPSPPEAETVPPEAVPTPSEAESAPGQGGIADPG
ncbi:MAG: right-handed parallel beta-helix repeat-containing protein [Planctomycetota bacterium]